MSIIKLFARTIVLLVCSIIQVIGVFAEGVFRLSVKSGRYLTDLDDKLRKEHTKKVKVKTSVTPT